LLATSGANASVASAHGAGGHVSSYATIDGSGSSYDYLPISQWITKVQTKGVHANYNPDSSPEGQLDYMNGHQVDFVASDLTLMESSPARSRTGTTRRSPRRTAPSCRICRSPR
jgi:hypothetical protein